MAKKERKMIVLPVTYSRNAANVNIPLPSTNTVYTDSYNMDDCETLSCVYKLNGVLSSANCIVTLEQSFEPPDVEGSIHASYVPVHTKGITAVGTWNYLNIASPLYTNLTSAYIAVPYIRFKVVSATTNTSATVNIKLCKQVEG